MYNPEKVLWKAYYKLKPYRLDRALHDLLWQEYEKVRAYLYE